VLIKTLKLNKTFINFEVVTLYHYLPGTWNIEPFILPSSIVPSRPFSDSLREVSWLGWLYYSFSSLVSSTRKIERTWNADF